MICAVNGHMAKYIIIKKLLNRLTRIPEIAYNAVVKKTDINKLLKKHLTSLQYKCYMRYLQGDKQKDIAKVLKISQPTVSQHIKYAEKKIKNLSRYL